LRQLMVLRHQVAWPRYHPSDRLVLAMLSQLVPRERWPKCAAADFQIVSGPPGSSIHAWSTWVFATKT
jgi:hypothetical protein